MARNDRPVGLRVDVDTARGMAEGVDRLLEIFDRCAVKATFFLSFGPDNSGQAIWNVFRQKGFLRKMIRTNALKLYGVRTVLSGLFGPPRMIACAMPDVVRRIEEKGHEIGLHAWDHRRWQDRIDRMDGEEIRLHLGRAAEAYEKILGRRPRSAAAPSWRITPEVTAAEEELGLVYASDLRFDCVCRLRHGERVFSVLQIPDSTFCLEEMQTEGVHDETQIVDKIAGALAAAPCPVFTVHAEVEGGPYGKYLERLIARVREKAGEPGPLEILARRALGSEEKIPVLELCRKTVAGRGCWMSSAR